MKPSGKFVINYFKLGQLDIAGRLWLKYISFITLPKIPIAAKKPSNKSCLTLNFVQKSPSSPRVELGGSKVLSGLNITFIEIAKITFHLGLNAAENTHHSQKSFK